MPTYFSFNFTIAEANQLAAYVESRDEGNHAGWYYGDPDKFQSRHRRILEELELRREIPRAAQETGVATCAHVPPGFACELCNHDGGPL